MPQKERTITDTFYKFSYRIEGENGDCMPLFC